MLNVSRGCPQQWHRLNKCSTAHVLGIARRAELGRLHTKHSSPSMLCGADTALSADLLQRNSLPKTQGSVMHRSAHRAASTPQVPDQAGTCDRRSSVRRVIVRHRLAAPRGAASPFSAGDATTFSSPPVVCRVVPGTGCDSMTRPSPSPWLPPFSGSGSRGGE